jgi:hypothetical protein
MILKLKFEARGPVEGIAYENSTNVTYLPGHLLSFLNIIKRNCYSR